MQDKAKTIEQTVLSPAKQRLLQQKQDAISRFVAAKEVLGKDWKDQLASFDPYFNTRDGEKDMNNVANSVKYPQKAILQRILLVTEAMEELVKSLQQSAA